MSQDTHMKSNNLESARGQVAKLTPKSIIEGIAAQMDRVDEAKRRIEEEGIVVRDLKGSVIPHPAIKIEADATKLIAELITKNSGGKSNRIPLGRIFNQKELT